MRSLLLIIKLAFLLLVLSSKGLMANAETFQINELPFNLKGQWTVCVQPQLDTKPDCNSHPVPKIIEDSFEDFNGYITYRAEFNISKDLANQSLGIYFKSIRDSDKVYLNNQMIGSTGSFPDDFKKATLYSRYYFLPSHLFKTDAINQLTVKVYNHARYGGIVGEAPIIHYADKISHMKLKQDSMIVFYMGMFLLIAVIQFFYYFAQKDHKEHLYFALLCITEAIYISTYTQLSLTSGLDINFMFRVNVFMFAVLTGLFCLFITEFFRVKRNLIIKFALLIVAISGLFQLTFLHLDYIYHQVIFLDIIGLLVFVPFYIFIFSRSIKEKQPYAKTMAIALLVHLVTAIIDIFVDLQILPAFFTGIAGMLTPLSLMLLFVIVSLILTHRHWIYYRHATYDYLTDALRRSAFEERLAEEIPRSQRLKQPLLIALLDIDNFKEINDSYSHIVGDKILRELVRRIKQELREFDLIARYGGDEFCFSAMVADSSDATLLLKRIQKQINTKPIMINEELSLSISITMGAFVAEPDHTHNPLDLLSLADTILVEGKVNQKGKIHI